MKSLEGRYLEEFNAIVVRRLSGTALCPIRPKALEALSSVVAYVGP